MQNSDVYLSQKLFKGKSILNQNTYRLQKAATYGGKQALCVAPWFRKKNMYSHVAQKGKGSCTLLMHASSKNRKNIARNIMKVMK